MEGYLSAKDICRLLSVGHTTVYMTIIPWIKAKCEKPFMRIGKSVRYRAGAVQEYINKHVISDY